MEKNRKIGSYEGDQRGPLLICIGAMHGNEPAGVKALELIFKMLEVEPITNSNFNFKGKVVGFIGNLQAYAQNKRFIDRDLNRSFRNEKIESVLRRKDHLLKNEDKELIELLECIQEEVKQYNPSKLYILDLHTTSSKGGIFCITTDDQESVNIAQGLHAPVVKGFLVGIQGTTLHYFTEETMGIPTVAVTFESGQHTEPLSTNRAIAAITNCLKMIGSVREQDVENSHNQILIEYSKNLPKVSQLIRRHDITPEDNFSMKPDFENFQRLQKGQVIAQDKNGPIEVSEDCLLLMPLYQDQGEEGFFLIKEIEHAN